VAGVSAAPGQPTLIQCLGEQVQVIAEPGALPPQTMLTCRPVEPGTVPPPPGEVVGETIFRVEASDGENGTLPSSVTIQVTYPPDAGPAAERDRLILGYLDGTEWQPVPEQDAEPADARVRAPADRTGVYALYRQP
jgi:hypothetical protein